MKDAKSGLRAEGVIPALVTPFTGEGAVDLPLLEKQAGYLRDAGVHGIMVGGTTAEGAYLTTREKTEIFRAVQGVVRGGPFLAAACLQPSTEAVLEEMKAFEPLGPDFIVAVTPYYFGASQEGIAEHFRRILRAAPAPLLLYNIPQHTHNPLALETILSLAAEEGVAGLKDSSGDFVSFTRGLLSGTPKPFSWIQGEDYLDAAALLLGARGLVTGLGNVRIEPYLRLYRAARERRAEEALACQREVNALYRLLHAARGKGIAAIKAGAAVYGRCSRRTRLPGGELTAEERSRIEELLR